MGYDLLFSWELEGYAKGELTTLYNTQAQWTKSPGAAKKPRIQNWGERCHGAWRA